MMNSKPKSVPCCDLGAVRAKCHENVLEDAKLFREIVGNLTYVMRATRPDLCYVVTKLSQHMA